MSWPTLHIPAGACSSGLCLLFSYLAHQIKPSVGSCACGSCGVCHVHQEEVGVGGAGTRHAGSHRRREEAGSGGGADAMGSEGGARTAVVGVGSGEAGVVATQSCSSSS